MFIYTQNNLTDELKWASHLLNQKQIFLNEYLNYKKVVLQQYPVVAEHLTNMMTCPLIKAFSIPFFTKNSPLRQKKEDVGYYNGICAPTYQMTPEEQHYIKYEKVLMKMFDFFYFSEDDLSYLFKDSLKLVQENVPNLWQAMIIEFKSGTLFEPHVHPRFILSSFNLNETEDYMHIEAKGATARISKEEPLLIFDSSYEHIAEERGKDNRILLVIGSEFPQEYLLQQRL